MVRSNDGRLFQMSGPQTANARRRNSVRVRRMTAALVDAERRDRRCESGVLNATRSATDSGDLVHEYHDFELDAVLHWKMKFKMFIIKSNQIYLRHKPEYH